MSREELVAAAMRTWEQSVIEAALGIYVPLLMPEAIRLVELRARVPRYQHDMLRVLAEQQGTSLDDVLSRELEGIACGYAEELRAAVVGFGEALAWPESGVAFVTA